MRTKLSHCLFAGLIALAGTAGAVQSVSAQTSTTTEDKTPSTQEDKTPTTQKNKPKSKTGTSTRRPTIYWGVYDNGFVADAQRALGVKADGDFGPITYRATVKFQRSRNLDVDGVIGKDTWAALGF